VAFPKFDDLLLSTTHAGACCDGNICTNVASAAACPPPKRFKPKCNCRSGGPTFCSTNESARSRPCCRKLERQVNQECDDLQPRQGTECFSNLDYNTCVGSDGTFGVWMPDLGYLEECCEQFPTYIPETDARRCPLPADLGRCCKGSPPKCCDGYTKEDCNQRGGRWEQGGECRDYTVDPPAAHPCPPPGACCEEGHCSQKLAAECFGQFYSGILCEDVDCSFDIPEGGPGCRTAKVNYGKREFEWSLDLCHPAKMQLAKRPDLDNGLFVLLTSHRVRAVEPDFSVDFSNQCKRHIGGIVLGYDGFFHPYIASQPTHGDETSIELSLGAAVRGNQSEERGMFLLVATYHTPFWTEAHMHSQDQRCQRIG
jgi:hypothetical protein